MLIYNYKKEFLGIDKTSLELLGLSNLEELRSEAGDIADLFVKAAGYVYNFEHIHWIDFIRTSMTNTSPKAIIHIKDKNFVTDIDIKHMFLVDSPKVPAYIIALSNIRVLRDSELVEATMPNPTPDTSVIPLQTAPSKVKHPYTEDFELPTVTQPTPTVQPQQEEIALDIPMQDEPKEEVKKPSVPLNDIPQDTPLEIDLDMDDDEPLIIPTTDEDEPKDEPVLKLDELVFDDEVKTTPQPKQNAIQNTNSNINEELLTKIKTYKYDPTVACEKLGLPIELIEEFIEDFIEQAYHFKPGLYNAFSTQNIDEIQSLSHKLKGVAANLHINDAFDVLSTINTSKDIGTIEENLEAFYMIINKLEGKDIFPDISSSPEENLEISPEPSVEPAVEEPAKQDDELDMLDINDMLLADTDETPAQNEVTITDVPTDTYEIDDDLNLELTDLSESEDEVPQIQEEKPVVEETMQDDDDFALSLEDLSFDDEEIELPSYDKNTIANEIGLDLESFNELLEDYKNEYNTISTEINQAISNQDIDAIKQNAQKLKLMSENMRMPDVIKQLDEVQNSSNLDEIKSIIKNIDSFISNI